MPSTSDKASLLRAIHSEAFAEGQKDGEHTALLLAIHVVDLFIARSDTLQDFKGKWNVAKAIYQEHTTTT